MESILGRKLSKDEIVHHKDGNKLNNNPDNLVVMSKKEHTLLHMKEGAYSVLSRSPEEKRKIMVNAWEQGVFDDLKQSVCAYDFSTGKLVKEYESLCEASRDGWNRNRISKCCRGLLKKYKGFIWKFNTKNNIEAEKTLVS